MFFFHPISEGTPDESLGVYGAGGAWLWVETQEPTSDVSTITFDADVSVYKAIRIEVFAEMTIDNAYAILQCSPDGSTWRTLGLGALASGAAGVTVNLWEILMADDEDGTHLRIAHNIHTSNKTASIDRSNNATNFNTTSIADAGTGGYTSYNEAIARIRLTTSSGNFEGSTGDRRSFARLYGMR